MKWPYQSTPYLSALPGVGGPGLDMTRGDLPSKLYFVTSTDNEKVGGPAPEIGPNCFAGTFWWCWYADQGEGFSKWTFPLVSGYCYVGKAFNTPERAHFDYVGHAAPGAGLFIQTCDLRVRSSDTRIWHLPSWVGDLPSVDGPDTFQADQRDALGASSGDEEVVRIAFINCEGRFTMDEAVEVWYAARSVSWIRGAIYDPLHIPPDFAMPEGSHHEEGVDHGYGQLFGGRTDASLSMQSLYAHTTDRNPLVAAPLYAHINNLHYNHGRPYIGRGEAINIDDNGEHNADANRSMHCNAVGCISVRGPEQGDDIVFGRVADVTPGSSGHSALNSVFGWPMPATQDELFISTPIDYMQPTVRPGAWPLGLGFDYNGVLKPCVDPMNPRVQEGLAFTQLIRETVGCMPARRYLYTGGINKVCDQIDMAIRGVPAPPQYINTVEEGGGWPALPTFTIDPHAPSKDWHAPLPLEADRDEILLEGTFIDGSSKVGYSRLRAWVIDQYFYVMGR
jgi:hypothetical protein